MGNNRREMRRKSRATFARLGAQGLFLLEGNSSISSWGKGNLGGRVRSRGRNWGNLNERSHITRIHMYLTEDDTSALPKHIPDAKEIYSLPIFARIDDFYGHSLLGHAVALLLRQPEGGPLPVKGK